MWPSINGEARRKIRAWIAARQVRLRAAAEKNIAYIEKRRSLARKEEAGERLSVETISYES